LGVDEIRKRIRALRNEKGLRAQDVAEMVKISRPFYTQLESGARGLTAIYLLRIAKSLDVTVGELCGEQLADSQVSEMRGHLVPVHNGRVRNILSSLLKDQPEGDSDWEIVLSETLKRLRQPGGEQGLKAG
jgi:transcriptional regulator with XRE-family HTH domain